MLKLLVDEHISRFIVRGLLRRERELDIVRVQDVGLRTKDDQEILAWAAQEGRVLITYDVSTIPNAAYKRVMEGLPMPGVIAIRSDVTIGRAIEDLFVVIGASFPDEWEGRVLRLPL
jgi:predicted nuclease of predicted toxin-antitoxin system